MSNVDGTAVPESEHPASALMLRAGQEPQQLDPVELAHTQVEQYDFKKASG